MSDGVRRALLLVGLLGFAALFVWGVGGLPPAGEYKGPYGTMLNVSAGAERHVTDVVTAVNFDYRGADTMGEEFILFTSVLGAAVLLKHEEKKKESGEKEGTGDDESGEGPPDSEAMRAAALGLVGLIVTFGLYVVLHGQLTPGGGFQGGVLLATVPLMVYLAGDPKRFLRIAPEALVETAEAVGAATYVLIGAWALVKGGVFLQNVLPLGPSEAKVTSGGTIPAINFATGVEVAGGFVLLLTLFLQQMLDRAREKR